MYVSVRFEHDDNVNYDHFGHYNCDKKLSYHSIST